MVVRHFAGSVPVAVSGAIARGVAMYRRFFDKGARASLAPIDISLKINGKRVLARRLHHALCFPRVCAGRHWSLHAVKEGLC